MDVDTGSTDLILCGSTACEHETRTVYNTTASSSSTNTSQSFHNSYGDGSTTRGTVFNDTVRFDGTAAEGQQINVASSMGGSLLTMQADGLVGFGFPALSSLAEGSSFPDTLFANGAISRNEFAFRLSNVSGDSQLYLGGYDRSQYTGSVSWYPMAKDTYSYPGEYSYFQLANSTAYVNGHAINSTSPSMIIDTGTTLMVAPKAAAAAFYSLVPNATALTGTWEGYYSYPCDAQVEVAFSFGGERLHTVVAEDFNFGVTANDEARCLGALMGEDAGVGEAWVSAAGSAL